MVVRSRRWRRESGVRFDTKLAIVVRNDLETWQKLNVTAFLAGCCPPFGVSMWASLLVSMLGG
jgi:hypothetical protein